MQRLRFIETITGIYLGMNLDDPPYHIDKDSAIELLDPIKVRFDIYPVPVQQRVGPPSIGFIGNVNTIPLPDVIYIRSSHILTIGFADESYRGIYDNAIKDRDEKRKAKKPLIQ